MKRNAAGHRVPCDARGSQVLRHCTGERHERASPTDISSFIGNRTFEEFEVDDPASVVRMLSQHDAELFAATCGTVDPPPMAPACASGDTFHRTVVHGTWRGAPVSAARPFVAEV